MRWADRRGNGSKVIERTTAQKAPTHRGAPLLAKSCTVSSAECALSERGKRDRRRSAITQCDLERAARLHSCVRGASANRFIREKHRLKRGRTCSSS